MKLFGGLIEITKDEGKCASCGKPFAKGEIPKELIVGTGLTAEFCGSCASMLGHTKKNIIK